MIGLHQTLEPAIAQMVSDRGALEDATTRLKQGILQNNIVHSTHRVNIVLTFFDTEAHSDHEILQIAAKELGLKYDDPPYLETDGGYGGPRQTTTACIHQLYGRFAVGVLVPDTGQCGCDELLHLYGTPLG